MKVEVDGFAFYFKDALNAFVFDEKDKAKPNYHGLPMKAVDIVAEFKEAYVYVEIKDFHDPDMYNEVQAANETEIKDKRDKFNWLKGAPKNSLYRGSFYIRRRPTGTLRRILPSGTTIFGGALKDYLKYKYRDSYLFRHAEHKANKPIHYICLLTFENALNATMQKALKRELPVGVASKRWKQEIAKSCQVLNLEQWNASFPKWSAKKIKMGS